MIWSEHLEEVWAHPLHIPVFPGQVLNRFSLICLFRVVAFSLFSLRCIEGNDTLAVFESLNFLSIQVFQLFLFGTGFILCLIVFDCV